MLARKFPSLLVLSVVAAGCLPDWDRLERLATTPPTTDVPVTPGDVGMDVTVGDAAMDVTVDVPQCTPASDTCPTGQYCAAGINQCVSGCGDDTDCMGGVDGGSVPTRCNVPTHTCVPCVIDAHCALGQLCMGNTCVDGCNPSHACPMDRVCCGGACVDTRSNTMHCGTCGSACSIPNGVPGCVAAACVVERCMPDRGDCDRSASNGCETDLVTTVMHCGACNRACMTYPHAATTCVGGMCRMGRCDEGYVDCDMNAANGCEVNTRADAMNCGTCGNACRFDGAVSACMSGVCTLTRCETGRGNCDGDPSNGCEVDFTRDVTNCGRCGVTCTVTRGTPQCTMGTSGAACGIARCDTGYGDCDGNLSTGCETDLLSTNTSCGTCGNICPTSGGTTQCRGGTCTVTMCAMGRDNCDGNDMNGCETDIRSNLTNCGRCGMACPARPNSAPSCVDMRCVNTCASNFGDCDGNETNGCETDTRVTDAHCNGCGRACMPPNASGQCASGTCRVRSCVTGFADCDAVVSNGCEANTQFDNSNCGACGRACAPANATGSCSSGVCRLTACTGVFGNCDGSDANGCEANLGSDSTNCGVCGVRCGTGRTCVVGRCALPSFAGYNVSSTVTTAWVDACASSGATTALAGADDELFVGDLPFPVDFWGGLNTKFLLNTNGVVGFGSLFYNLTAIPSRGLARSWGGLPTTTGPAPAAYVFGVDLVTRGAICMATTGTAPNRTWIVTYPNTQLYVSTEGTVGLSQYTFELMAYESSANIDFLYNAPFTTPFGLTPTAPDPVTVGLQDFRSITSPRAAQYSGAISATTRIRFTPM